MRTNATETLIHLNNERQRLTVVFDEAIAYSQDPTVDPVVTALTLAETSRKAPKPAVASLTGPAPEAPKPGPITASMGCMTNAGPAIATFGVCIRYLSDALPDAKKGAVVLSTEDNLSPIRVTSLQAPNRVVVIMPMRL